MWPFASKEAYTWQACYTDGSIHTERELGTFAAVDANACVAVEAVPRRRGLPRVRIELRPGQLPVFLRRHRLVINPNGEQAIGHEVVTCVGWVNSHSGEYTFIFNDGHTLVTSDFQAV